MLPIVGSDDVGCAVYPTAEGSERKGNYTIRVGVTCHRARLPETPATPG
jgi:hypothetical protein